MERVQRKLLIPALTILLMMAFCISAHADSRTWNSSANGNSKQVTYTLKATPIRTGEKAAKVNYEILAKWKNGGESHGQPTKITGKVACKGQTRTFTIKNRGTNSFNKVSGTFYINVGANDTVVSVAMNASGSGSYQTSRTVYYTYYTTSSYYCQVDRYNGAHSSISASRYWSLANASSAPTTTWIHIHTESIRHTGSKTVWDTHNTNSGTLATQSYTAGTMEKWYYVKYDAVGGSPTPATHGFIGGKSTKISRTVPKYWCEDIKKYGYTNNGWSTAKYALNTGSPNYKANDVYNKKADLQLYAVYRANKIARIVFNANGGNKNSVPAQIDKYYNVNVTLPNKIPTYPATTNKGVRHYFLRWNTKADGTGINFNAGAVFNLNANPHEKIPQDVINLYAIWYEGTDKEGVYGETPENNPGIRYIEKDATGTLNEDSKWRSGVRQQQLEDSLNRDGSGQAKSVYDSEGNKIK